MMNILITIVILFGLGALVFVGLTYFISSIWEREKRASVFAGLQFLGMTALLGIFWYFVNIGFFEKQYGTPILIGIIIL